MDAVYGSDLYSPRVGTYTDVALPPDLPPWSPYSVEHPNQQMLPTDIPADRSESPSSPRWGTDSVQWIDRTSLDIAFDHSCFDALDEQLLHHPTQSFADVCWADAVSDVSNAHTRRSASPPPPPSADLSSSAADMWDVSDPEPEEEHLDPSPAPTLVPIQPFSDKLNTVSPGKRLAAEPSPFPFHAKPDSKPKPDTRVQFAPPAIPSLSRVSPAPAPSPPQSPFVPFLPPHFTPGPSDPSESIGFFPTRPRPPPQRPSAKMPSRFFAYFHARV
ncbi:hypothetical protein B0H13DRAFT_1857735 [Mycena leptocephala]|nr:hypothetical protein B0H13DRAFT_1857735 [Mycena leptocephala]